MRSRCHSVACSWPRTRDVLVRSLVGGIIRGARRNVTIRYICAFLPLARTERPLSEEAGTGRAANIALCLCVAIGIVVVASQKTRVTANKV